MKIFDAANVLKFYESSPPFYEVYFFKFHLIEEGLAFWFRYTLHRPLQGNEHVSLWAFAFDEKNPERNAGGLKNYELSHLRTSSGKFEVQIGDALFNHDSAQGSIQQESITLSWDLQLKGNESPLELFPYQWMYRNKIFPKTKYVSTRPSVLFTGKVIWNGREYEVKDAPGMQSHLWGSQHAASFLWVHCNTFLEDRSALLEGFSAQVLLGSWKSPPINLFYLRMFGKEYFLNTPKLWFQKDLRRDLTEWTFDFQQGEDRFIGAIGTDPKQFLGVRYQDPREGFRYCNHAEWALASLEHYKRQNGRWCLESTLTSKAATYEWLDSVPHPSVRVKVLG